MVYLVHKVVIPYTEVVIPYTEVMIPYTEVMIVNGSYDTIYRSDDKL